MSLPTLAEAAPIAVPVPVRELRIGDEVGPQDVTLPPDFTVVSVPQRSAEEQRSANVTIHRRLPDGILSTQTRIGRTQVFVRRYSAVAHVTRTAGGVEALPLVLRTVDENFTTPVDPAALRLRPGDVIALVAP